MGLSVLLNFHLPVVSPVVGGELGHLLLDLSLGGEVAASLPHHEGLLVAEGEDMTLHGLGVPLLIPTLLHAAVIERIVPLVPGGELRDELQPDHRLAGGLQLLEEGPQLWSLGTAASLVLLAPLPLLKS